MHKRSAIIILLIVVAAAGVLAYLTKQPVQKAVLLAGPSNVPVSRKTGAPAEVPKTSPIRPRGYSESEYAQLRQRFKPRPPAAEGPLSGYSLQVTERAVKQDLYPKESWPLVKAALSGDVTAVSNALDTGVTANTNVFLMYPYNANVPLLDFAIWGGQREVIKLLLDHGAALSPAEYGTPAGGRFRTIAPLTYAAEFGEDDVLRLLLDHGADIEQRNDFDSDNSTALNVAVAGSEVSTVYLLLSKGADISSALRPDGSVPLYLLQPNLSPTQLAVRDLLIAHGATMPASQQISH